MIGCTSAASNARDGFELAAAAIEAIGELGVGVALPWKRRSERQLATALDDALRPAVSRRAGQLAARLRDEGGPAVAAGAIEAEAARS